MATKLPIFFIAAPRATSASLARTHARAAAAFAAFAAFRRTRFKAEQADAPHAPHARMHARAHVLRAQL
jgi:hypothetical protein